MASTMNHPMAKLLTVLLLCSWFASGDPILLFRGLEQARLLVNGDTFRTFVLQKVANYR